MFGRNKPTQVVKTLELSDEMKQALTSLENDVQVLSEMLRDVLGTSRDILGALTGQLASEISDGDELPESRRDGIRVFAGEEPSRRTSAFRRRPVVEQYEEIREILSDGKWHNAYTEAKRLAGDEREYRYLRGAISGRMRELYEAGELHRQNCNQRGAMFEYRLNPAGKKVL